MIAQPALVMLHGGPAAGEAERALAEARWAAGLDSLEVALSTGLFASAVAGVDREFDASLLPENVLLDVDREEFHFGRRLGAIVERYGLERPCYFGAGSVPLMGPLEFATLAEQLLSRDRIVVSNNFFSADLVAWQPGDALLQIVPPETDNALPRCLKDQAGLTSVTLPRTSGTQFDVDSPIDLAVLSLCPEAGPRLSASIAERPPGVAALRAVMPVLTDKDAELVVAGRVGSQTWQYLERETACRVRVFSEERGMRAAGREDGGAVSLLGALLEREGPQEFFGLLARMGDALLMDTRVLFSHLGWRLSAEDRFQSDLMRPERISHLGLRAFTEAAREAPIPVVLGGHSLVSGGLMVLVDLAWRERDLERGRTP